MAYKLTEEWLPDSTSFLFCFPALEIICDLGSDTNGIATGRVPPSVPPTQKKFTVSNLPSPPTEKNPPPTIRKSSPVWPSAPSSIRDKVHDTWTWFLSFDHHLFLQHHRDQPDRFQRQAPQTGKTQTIDHLSRSLLNTTILYQCNISSNRTTVPGALYIIVVF